MRARIGSIRGVIDSIAPLLRTASRILSLPQAFSRHETSGVWLAPGGCMHTLRRLLAPCIVASLPLFAVGCGSSPGDGVGTTSQAATIAVLRGVDSASVLSASAARLLQSNYGVQWTGVYIGGPCSAGSGWDRASVDAIAQATKWSFLPTYVGQESSSICGASNLTEGQGQADGHAAASIMPSFGWEAKRDIPIALDVEQATYADDPSGAIAYVRGWVAAVKSDGYLAYVYSNPDGINAFASAGLAIDAAWVASYFYSGFASVTPYDLGQIGGNFSHQNRAWQYAGNVFVSGVGAVDCDVSDMVLAPGPGGSNVGSTPAAAAGSGSGIAVNEDGRLEAFVRGTDNAVSHDWQTTPEGATWSGWSGLGGILSSDPRVALNANGTLEIFYLGTNGAVFHRWQTSAGGSWSNEASLGGDFVGQVAVARNADGRLEAFSRGTDDALLHDWQTTPGGSWSGWSTLGGILASDVTVGANKDGALEVFYQGTNHALFHRWQTTPGGSWSSEASIGGALAGDVAVGTNDDGRLEAFYEGTDRALWHVWQTTAGGSWSSAASIGGVLAGDPAVARNQDGRLEVFFQASPSDLQHVWQTTPGGSWSNAGSLGGTLGGGVSVQANADGRLEVFYRGAAGALWHQWQTTSGGSWSAAASLGGDVAAP